MTAGVLEQQLPAMPKSDAGPPAARSPSRSSTRRSRPRWVRNGSFAKSISRSNLTHPHIVPIYSAGEVADLLRYAMPYVEGESLRDRLTREKQLGLDDALLIAREVADALSYAHSHGVIKQR